MSAVNSLQPASSPGAEHRPYEPSMEEILASIRRIIADDQPLPPIREPEARGPEAARDSVPGEAAEIVAPDPVNHPRAEKPPRAEPPVHVVPEAPPVAMQPHGEVKTPQYPTMPDATVAPPPPDEPDAQKPEVRASDEEKDDIFSSASTVHDHADDQPADDHEHPYRTRDAHRGGPDALHREPRSPEVLISEATDHSVTAAFNALAASRLADNSEELLGIARDMIRPLLKVWIDDNLPSMVERMVRAEIERVARGGR